MSEAENEAEPILQTLLRDPTAGVLVADAGGRILRANDMLRQLLAPSVNLAPGADLVGIFAADARMEARQALHEILLTRTPRALFSRLEVAAPDPHHAVAVTALPLPAEAGEARLLLRIADITAQRQLEAQLAQSQKLQALGQLAGGIAHDFNNLLTAILGTAEMVQNRVGLDAQTQSDMAQIRRAGDRGAALVRQLLAFGRQQSLQPRVIALDPAIRDIVRLLRPLLGGQIRLVLELESPEQLVKVDPAQFDRVLVNLALNARDAMPQGGTLTLHSGHVTIYRPLTSGAETIPPGSYVMVEMRDTGIGIAPDILPRIFDPFFTTRREQGGTGLGLASVHGIIGQSDGFLTVESTPGRGTSLRIYLPRAAGPADPGAEPALAASTADGATMDVAAMPGTILVVDDETMVSSLIARALRRQGWEVMVHDSGESALAWQGEQAGTKLAGVISDVAMPGMDGPDLVRALRQVQPGLPAILISGYVHERLCTVLSYENIAFLPKPYTMKDLLALVTEAIAGAPPAAVPI